MNGSKKVVGKAETVSESAKTQTPSKVQTGASARSPGELHEAIAVAAYYFAQARNFEVGHEMEDWLKAEAQVLA